MKWIMTNAGGRGNAEGRVSGKWKWRISFWAVPSSPLQWLPFLLFIYDLAMSCLFCHSFLTSASSTSKLPLFWSCLDFMHCCSRGRKVGSSDGVLVDIVTLASFLPSSLSLPRSAEEYTRTMWMLGYALPPGHSPNPSASPVRLKPPRLIPQPSNRQAFLQNQPYIGVCEWQAQFTRHPGVRRAPCCITVIPTTTDQRQEEQEFKGSLGYKNQTKSHGNHFFLWECRLCDSRRTTNNTPAFVSSFGRQCY